ncbi:fimbrial protein [Escherichia albertii]|uniref:hypothetical protein n=1 Tax=Escherichia albertii TaxID=208962 RepID=UPI0011ED66E3|nr:hypothetical protein [Escherichia albertii]MCU7316323.1 hypothetical protein [Escherichia albertii]MCU7320821.1 hypothetical protein [Escherichia albertii]
MKKLMIASAIAMIMAAGSAMADVQQGSQSEVQFIGTVAAKTCDVVVSGDGAVNNQVQFGTVEVGGTVDKEFTVKLKDPECLKGVSRADSTKATFTWYSPKLSEQGFENQSGTAEGSYVVLKAKDSATNTADRKDAINDLNNKIGFTISQAEQGFQYQATLHAGSTAGSFATAASYTIAYE